MDLDDLGRYAGPKRTYRAAGNVVAAAGTAPFLIINGAATKVIRIMRIRITGLTLTAVQYLRVQAAKYSTAPSGGTPAAATVVKLDSAAQASGATVNGYTAAPTPGTLVGPIAERTVLGQATTPAAGGLPQEADFWFDFNYDDEGAILRAAAENIGILFAAAPATAVTLSYEIEFTEDGN